MPKFSPRPDFRPDFDRAELDPLAAYPAGTRLTDLRTAESLLVVALRLWTARRIEPNAGHADWRDGFLAAALCSVGVACFQSFISILEAAATRPIMMGRPRCDGLTEDEARLLCAIGCLQRERAHDAALLLADWLPPAAVRIATDYACGLATALAEARLTLPERSANPATPAPRRFIHATPLTVMH
ncbi:MAG: hypothetical protein ACK4NA_11845 [Alphaproteobacteria bacterium]